MKREICVIGLFAMFDFVHNAEFFENSRNLLTKLEKSGIIYVFKFNYCQGTYNIIQIMLLSLDTLSIFFYLTVE